MTRDEFATAVAGLLTEDQRRQVRDLHDRVDEAYDGCAAHHEGTDCCMDALVGERWIEVRPPVDEERR